MTALLAYQTHYYLYINESNTSWHNEVLGEIKVDIKGIRCFFGERARFSGETVAVKIKFDVPHRTGFSRRLRSGLDFLPLSQ